jgi:hypothetical protein
MSCWTKRRIVCEGFTGNVILKLAESLHGISERQNLNTRISTASTLKTMAVPRTVFRACHYRTWYFMLGVQEHDRTGAKMIDKDNLKAGWSSRP